mgnify:CR=1 FL=1
MEKKTFYLTCERTWVYDTLIFAAGILGSYTYMLCGGIFCNAQTGNIVLLGIALGTRSWTSALYYVIPISAYALGAFISELIPDDVKHLPYPLGNDPRRGRDRIRRRARRTAGIDAGAGLSGVHQLYRLHAI